MESNIGCDLNLEDSFRVKKLASLVDQKIANLLRNNVWRQKILTSSYSHEGDNDEDGDPYSHEDDDPSWGVVELAGRVDKAYLIFNMSNVCLTTTTKMIEEKNNNAQENDTHRMQHRSKQGSEFVELSDLHGLWHHC